MVEAGAIFAVEATATVQSQVMILKGRMNHVIIIVVAAAAVTISVIVVAAANIVEGAPRRAKERGQSNLIIIKTAYSSKPTVRPNQVTRAEVMVFEAKK